MYTLITAPSRWAHNSSYHFRTSQTQYTLEKTLLRWTFALQKQQTLDLINVA